MITVTVQPAKPALEIGRVLDHLHLIEDEEDLDLVRAYILAAEDWAQTQTGRTLITRTVRIDMECFEERDKYHGFELPVSPVQSITQIQYYDTNNAIQTLAGSGYMLFDDRLRPIDSWPSTYDRPDAVQVTAVAGYGDDAANVPSTVQQAMLLVVGALYEDRSPVTGVPRSASVAPMAVHSLLAPYLRPTWV